MPKKIVKNVGMMQRETLQYDPREPGAREACIAAWDAAVPMARPGDMPGDAYDRETAKRCKEIIEKSKEVNSPEGPRATEADAEWIAAEWLAAFGRMRAQRDRLMAGDTSPDTIGAMLMHAQDMGRLQERMAWRAGVDPQTGKRGEALALSGRRQVKGGHDGNAMKGAKSFAATHATAAQARADALHRENPRRTWARIRQIIAQEYGVSVETVRKSLRNPKKNG